MISFLITSSIDIFNLLCFLILGLWYDTCWISWEQIPRGIPIIYAIVHLIDQLNLFDLHFIPTLNSISFSRYRLELTSLLYGPINIESSFIFVESELHVPFFYINQTTNISGLETSWAKIPMDQPRVLEEVPNKDAKTAKKHSHLRKLSMPSRWIYAP